MEENKKSLHYKKHGFKHTPNHWWVDDDGFIASGTGDDYLTVGDPHCSGADIDEREANALLMAASPDLLEKSIQLIEYLGEDWGQDPFVHRLIEAVQKAVSDYKPEYPDYGK